MSLVYWSITHDPGSPIYVLTPRLGDDPDRLQPDLDPRSGSPYEWRAGSADHAVRLLRRHHPGARAVFRWSHPVSLKVSWLNL